eukprot:scaffold37937_cov66-Phaeocystis_antarctica.AAC.3
MFAHINRSSGSAAAYLSKLYNSQRRHLASPQLAATKLDEHVVRSEAGCPKRTHVAPRDAHILGKARPFKNPVDLRGP